jgi:hypothetical protein
MEGRPPDTKGNCKYMEQEVADSRQGVILHVGSWVEGKPLTVKSNLLRNISKRFGPGLILWHDVNNGKRTGDMVLGTLGFSAA